MLRDKYCPHCGKRFEFQIGVGNDGIIGKPTRECPLCKNVMGTGLTEWDNASLFVRLRHVLYAGLWTAGGAFLGGAILGLTVALLRGDINNSIVQGTWMLVPATGATLGAALGIWSGFLVVRDSQRRTRRSGDTKINK